MGPVGPLKSCFYSNLSLVVGLIFFAPGALAAPVANSLGSYFPGIHQLVQTPYREALDGLRLGLVVNQASRTASGEHSVDFLRAQSGLNLTQVISLGQGFRAEHTSDQTTDPVSGLPLTILTADSSQIPEAVLSGVDFLIFDAQLVGYRDEFGLSVLRDSLRVAKARSIPIAVTDRPNLITAERFDGLVGDSADQKIPYWHGMTSAEASLYFNFLLSIGAELRAVPMQGWKRNSTWESLGVDWVSPASGIASDEQAFLYGVFGFARALGMHVGEGEPEGSLYRYYGFKGLDETMARQLTQELSSAALPGLAFSPAAWGDGYRGVFVYVTDRTVVDLYRSALVFIRAWTKVPSAPVDWTQLDQIFSSPRVREGVFSSREISELLQDVLVELEDYKKLRNRVLLYSTLVLTP